MNPGVAAAAEVPRSPRAEGDPGGDGGASTGDEQPADSEGEGGVDSEGDFAMGVNQVAKATDVEIMSIANSEFYKLTGRRNVPDVSEVFSRGRFTSHAKEFGMLPGFALDYRTGWDLSYPRQAEEAELLRSQTRPKFLLGSPPCSAFSQLLTFASATPERQEELQDVH